MKESMGPTQASAHPRVIEANQIVGQMAFRVMHEARTEGNAMIFESAQGFLNGPDYGRPRGRKK